MCLSIPAGIGCRGGKAGGDEMIIFGYEVLKNERAWKLWRSKNYYGSDEPGPEEYPCIVEEQIDGHENPYIVFIYRKDITRMEKALSKYK